MLDELKKLEIKNRDYIPNRIINRKEELKKLGEWVKKGLGRNILITSPESGTGKTVTSKWFMKNNQNISYGYVLCDERSPYKLYKEIADVISYKTGIEIKSKRSKGDLADYVRKVFSNKDINFILCLDEIDYTINNYDDGVLSSLLHIQKETKGRLHLILISNDIGFKNKLRRKVRSRLNEISIIFNQYFAGTGAEILKYYLYDEGLLKKEYRKDSEEIHRKLIKFIDKIATGDMRKILQYFIIWAERCKNKLDLSKLDENFFNEIDKKEVVEFVGNISGNEKKILLSLIKSKIDERKFTKNKTNLKNYPRKYINTNKTRLRKYYHWVCRKTNTKIIKERQFKHYLKELKGKGLIHIQKKGLGQGKGTIGLYHLSDDIEDFLEEIVKNITREFGIELENIFAKPIDRSILR